MRIKPTGIEGPRLYGRGRGSVPSVTTVLQVIEKRHLEDWRRKVGTREADRISANAKLLGTKIHSAAQLVAWGEEDKVPEEVEPYAAAVKGFLDKHVMEVLGTEVELVSEKHRFGGTLDLWCQLHDGSYAVVDYKTSSSLTREHNWQTAGYALLLRENGYRVNTRIVVRIKKDKPGEWYARFCREHLEDAQGFLACVNLWWSLNRSKMKKVLES